MLASRTTHQFLRVLQKHRASTPAQEAALERSSTRQKTFAELIYLAVPYYPSQYLALCPGYIRKLQRYDTLQLEASGFVDDTHPTVADFSNDSVIGDGATDHTAIRYRTLANRRQHVAPHTDSKFRDGKENQR